MSKMSATSLSDRDKTPAPGGWGHYFYPTTPQRRVTCVLGDMLAPLSADDIAPITPSAMASVQAALTLLANLVGDQDHGRFLGLPDARLEECRGKARDILLAARGLAGILRVVEAPGTAPTAETSEVTPSTTYDVSNIDLPRGLGRVEAGAPITRSPATTTMPPTNPSPADPSPADPSHPADPALIQLQVDLTTAEVSALKEASAHVRQTMAHYYSWKSRDTAMEAMGKILTAAQR